jgi:hypothetical protein
MQVKHRNSLVNNYLKHDAELNLPVKNAKFYMVRPIFDFLKQGF